MLLQFTSPYLKKFIKKYLPDPFEDLLEDEAALSRYKRTHPKEAISKSKENVAKVKKRITTYREKIDPAWRNKYIDTESTSSYLEGNELGDIDSWGPTTRYNPNPSPATKNIRKAVRKLSSHAQKLSKQVFKEGPTGGIITKDLQVLIEDTKNLILITTGIEKVIDAVEKQGAPDIGEAIILKSSWLNGSVARFSSNPTSYEDFVNNLTLLITRLGQY